MTRSHALLHCSNATLVAARAEAWDGRDPGSVRVLLSNPRWEGRFLRFLEISGMGRTVDGLDVEEAHASRLDQWIIWETGEEGGGVADNWCSAFVFSFFVFHHKILAISCKGDPYPAICAQRTLGAEDFLCSGLHAGAAAGFLCLSFVYIPLRGERL
jgi:hypothetical protein